MTEAVISTRKTVIKMPENINRILGKLTEVLQMTHAGCDIVGIAKDGEYAVIRWQNGSQKKINISCDSGISAVHDIIKGIMY